MGGGEEGRGREEERRGGTGGGEEGRGWEGERRGGELCKNLLSIFTLVAMTINIPPVAVPSTAAIRALKENSKGVFVTTATSSTPSPSPT